MYSQNYGLLGQPPLPFQLPAPHQGLADISMHSPLALALQQLVAGSNRTPIVPMPPRPMPPLQFQPARHVGDTPIVPPMGQPGMDPLFWGKDPRFPETGAALIAPFKNFFAGFGSGWGGMPPGHQRGYK